MPKNALMNGIVIAAPVELAAKAVSTTLMEVDESLDVILHLKFYSVMDLQESRFLDSKSNSKFRVSTGQFPQPIIPTIIVFSWAGNLR